MSQVDQHSSITTFELKPTTEPGEQFVHLAEQHAAEAADAVAERDRQARFPTEIVESMKKSGFTGGAIPEQFGGLGVGSLRDLAIGVSRIARVDASLAIAIQMHFSISYMASRSARYWMESETPENAGAYELFLGILAGGSVALSNHTEPGTDLYHPLVTATRSGDDWVLNGRKSFGTSSPAADVFIVACRIDPGDDDPQVGTAVVFKGSEGVTVHDNWDGLGMRSSGSHDITYENCAVPDGFLSWEGPWGVPSVRSLEVASAANLGLTAAFLGVAEGARDLVASELVTRTKKVSGKRLSSFTGIQHGMAELEIDLASARAQLDWISRVLDVHFARPVRALTTADLDALNAQFQASKLVINRAAVAVVDRAMQLSGGSGYLASSPLARMYRDVRAGSFMQAFSPNEAYEFIGQQALGEPIRYFE